MRPTMQIVSKNVVQILCLSSGDTSPAAARNGTQHRPLLSREVCIRHLFVLTLKLPELPWLGI